MSASTRLAIATNGFRGGIIETIYIDQALATAVDYETLSIEVESVQAIGANFGPIEIDVEIEGCY